MKTCLALLLSFSLALPVFPADDSIRGFLSKDVAKQRELEEQLQAIPEAARAKRYLQYMAAEPHHAGSPRSKAVAEYALGLFREWGIDAQIEEFEALLPYPTDRLVEMVSPVRFTAKLKEPRVASDPHSADPNQLPTYNAYSASGDVTGDVVYVNYGSPEDYEWLAKRGLDVKGKIVLARYGKNWRGIKPKLAAEHGAIACLIYSDPHEDGYFEGDVYPKGAFRPRQGAQRGSVVDMPLYPGDPLSPGWASEKGAKKLTREEAKSLMTIPVLPISYGDARPILARLEGPVAPASWRGALPLTYHVGPGPAKLHVRTDFDWTTKPLYNVIATIPGSEFPDEWILYGNHHDAWVNGASDPGSGAASLLETARTLAVLTKSGWQPKRTIKFALWDGEEFGLLGSTEWAEKHQDELKEKAITYFNSDSNGKGWINLSGSHMLEDFLMSVGRAVEQPGSKDNLVEAAIRHAIESKENQQQDGRFQDRFKVGALGAGSDYVAFLDFLGISSVNASFGGDDAGGVYHSVYDSLYWFSHFSDGTFTYNRALSQFMTTALVRLSNASILPFEFGAFTSTVQSYLDEIEREAAKSGKTLNLTNVKKELSLLETNGATYEQLLQAGSKKSQLNTRAQIALNQTLLTCERTLTRSEGLPNRSWYKHQIYAPGFYTGYGVKTLPGIREAVEAKKWWEAETQAQMVAESLDALNQQLLKATEQIGEL